MMKRGEQEVRRQVREDLDAMYRGIVPPSWELDGCPEALETCKDVLRCVPRAVEDAYDAVAFNTCPDDDYKAWRNRVFAFVVACVKARNAHQGT